MRDSFVDALIEAARADARVVLLTGDLGFGALDEFQAEFPSRFINAGVAEQNMVSLAAGMSTVGLKPVIYSIANFPTYRAAEQLRNDIDYPTRDVVVVAVGGGVSYGALGFSHHALTDYGLFLSLPNFDIIAPTSPEEVDQWTKWAILNPGPKYIRLDKALVPIPARDVSVGDADSFWSLHKRAPSIEASGCILATGGVLHLAVELQSQNPTLDVITAPVWGRQRTTDLLRTSQKYSCVTTVESQLSGGFGSWVADSLRESNWSGHLQTLTFSPQVVGAVGSREYLEAIATEAWGKQLRRQCG